MQAFAALLTGLVMSALVAAPLARADALQDELKARIEAALAHEDAAARFSAVHALFHSDGADDDFTLGLLSRVAGIVVELRGHAITFEALPAGVELLHVVDGYEYRPNVAPLGRVVFTDPAAAPGNDTKVLYGRHPDEARLVFPLTMRTLVNPDAPPDKQLQMLAVGQAHPPATFAGWCDIALSNNTTKRVAIDDQDVGNQTLIMRGQSIEACEITNTGGRGTLSLRLYEDDREIFVQQIELPATPITYRKP